MGSRYSRTRTAFPFLYRPPSARELDRGAAFLATRADAADRDDSLAKVPGLRDGDLDLPERLVPLSELVADALVSPIHRRYPPEHHHLEHRVPLHLGVESLQERVDVSAVERVDSALEDIDVLLRHRPRSISPKGRSIETFAPQVPRHAEMLGVVTKW